MGLACVTGRIALIVKIELKLNICFQPCISLTSIMLTVLRSTRWAVTALNRVVPNANEKFIPNLILTFF